jgi:hypothetical protein
MKSISILRKALVLAIVTISVSNIIYSQKQQEIFNRMGPEIVWLGLDFTQVRMVGPLGTVDKNELVQLFDDINMVVISERSKYNFEAALRKDEVPYNLEVATKLNSEIDPNRAIAYASKDEAARLNEEAISVLVKQYKFDNKEGIGLVFFMETLDKVREQGTMWVTFFSLSDRNVLFTERMSGIAGGISFRNHWARTVYEVIDQIRNTKFAEWRFRYVN